MRASETPSPNCPEGLPCLEHLCHHHPGCVRRRKRSFDAVVATGATPKYVPHDDVFVADERFGLRGVSA